MGEMFYEVYIMDDVESGNSVDWLSQEGFKQPLF
jgi:hypothetical protein